MWGLIRGLVAAGFILAVWQAIVWLGDMPPFILPSPARVATTLFDSLGLIGGHTLITLGEVVAGLVLGTALGVATALQLATSRAARYLIKPLLIATQALPVYALAPILVLWLGFGMGSKILMTVLIVYFPVASAFFDGLMRTDRGWLDLAATMGASPNRVLWRIQVPAAVPSLTSGLRLAAVYAPIGAVIGEFVGSSGGLGFLMLLANGRAKIDLMFAALFVLALMTVLLHAAVGAGCRQLERAMR